MESELSDEIYERMFRAALLIRMVEKRIVDIYPTDKIQSPVHLSIGQEAVAVGVCEALRLDDLVYATYRSHGFYIAKGGSLRAMFAELYGRVGGGLRVELAKGVDLDARYRYVQGMWNQNNQNAVSVDTIFKF